MFHHLRLLFQIFHTVGNIGEDFLKNHNEQKCEGLFASQTTDIFLNLQAD